MNRKKMNFLVSTVVPLSLLTASFTQAECVDRGFSTLENQVLNSYIAYYGRPADPAGLTYWAKKLDDEGGSLSSIINAFGVSAEFDERFGDLSPEDLITNLYQQLFNRDPEEGGFDYWLGQYTSGERTLQNIALALLDGAQNEDLDIVTNRNLTARHFVSQSECAGIELSEPIYNSLMTAVNEVAASTTEACGLVDDSIESQGGICTHATWSSKMPLPNISVAPSSCVVGGKLYVFGVQSEDLHTGQALSREVDMYKPQTDTWTRRADMPTDHAWGSASVVNGKCYVIGGAGSDEWNVVEEYDPQTDTWRSRSNLPLPRNAHGSAAVNGMIYVLGGANGGWEVPGEPETFIYDPATDQWSRGTDIPTPRGGVAAAAVDGYIYVIGGSTGGPNSGALNLSAAVHRYDPVTDQWTERASVPTPLGWASASVYGGMIYVFGGLYAQASNDAIADVYRYDPQSDEWTQLLDMDKTRQSFTSATIGGRIFLAGGRTGRGFRTIADVDAYTP